MDWRTEHGKVIDDFLTLLNSEKEQYVLKGGTALAKCYNLDRFSEDIDLDGKGHSFIKICQDFADRYGYGCREAKNTDTVKRCMIHYGGVKPLKIEMSARRKTIAPDEVVSINGIRTYTIDVMAMMKANAYQQRDKIRDLYDVSFIINHYYEELSASAKFALQNALQYKGIEHFDYIVSNQADELIDSNALAENFLNALDKVGLILEKDERETMNEEIQEPLNIGFKQKKDLDAFWAEEKQVQNKRATKQRQDCYEIEDR